MVASMPYQLSTFLDHWRSHKPSKKLQAISESPSGNTKPSCGPTQHTPPPHEVTVDLRTGQEPEDSSTYETFPMLSPEERKRQIESSMLPWDRLKKSGQRSAHCKSHESHQRELYKFNGLVDDPIELQDLIKMFLRWLVYDKTLTKAPSVTVMCAHWNTFCDSVGRIKPNMENLAMRFAVTDMGLRYQLHTRSLESGIPCACIKACPSCTNLSKKLDPRSFTHPYFLKLDASFHDLFRRVCTKSDIARVDAAKGDFLNTVSQIVDEGISIAYADSYERRDDLCDEFEEEKTQMSKIDSKADERLDDVTFLNRDMENVDADIAELRDDLDHLDQKSPTRAKSNSIFGLRSDQS